MVVLPPSAAASRSLPAHGHTSDQGITDQAGDYTTRDIPLAGM